MILRPYTFNGTNLLTSSSTDYDTTIPRTNDIAQIAANVSYVKRAGAVPVYAGKDIQSATIQLDIIFKHDGMTLLENINQLFDVKDETPKLLVVQDTEDATAENPKQYQVYATPKRVIGTQTGALVELAIDDPIWESVTRNTQNFVITSATDSTSVTANGNDYSYPVFEITPTSQPSTDYLYNSYMQVLPTSTDPWPNRPLYLQPTTDTWDTAALIAAGKMQSAGQDIRALRDGNFIDYQLSGINTTDTKVLVVSDMPASILGTLKTTIPSTDTPTEIEYSVTALNKTKIAEMPAAGRAVVYSTIGSTDTEEITYTAKTITATKLALTGVTWAVRNTVRVTHTAGDVIAFEPYDFNIIYGNTTVAAYVIDQTRKPIIAVTSSNSSFIYTNFFDEAGLRAGIFKKNGAKVSKPTLSRSGVFSSTNDVEDVDPATEIGIGVYTYQNLGVWAADTVAINWLGYFPDKIASIVADGDQFQTGSSKPNFYVQVGITPTVAPVTAATIAAQASTDYGTWTTWSKASTDFVFTVNKYNYLYFSAVGTISGTTDVTAKAGASGVTVGLSNPPHVMIRPESNNYKLDCVIRNETTGEFINVTYPMLLNETLYIDTNPDFPTAKYNGQIVNAAVTLSSIRSAWLKLQPGANSIGFESNLAAASNLTIAIKFYDRANFF